MVAVYKICCQNLAVNDLHGSGSNKEEKSFSLTVFLEFGSSLITELKIQ